MILDTSVLFDALVAGARSERARALIEDADILRFPDLIETEIAGALTRAVRRREISVEIATPAFELAQELITECESTRPFVTRAFGLSLELAHPVADCVFLAMAESTQLPLATSDARLARKLTTTRYAKLVHLV